MINLLGVSKAILDNVIFCHQEEFCWPLSDPKSLKTRFDDIFSATKYIKALDALKKVRLEQAQVIRQCTTEIKFLKQNKEKAEEIKQDMTKTEVKLKACNDSVNKIQERLKPLQELLQNIAEQNKKLAKLTNKRDTLTAEKTMLETQIVDLRKQIPEMYDGSDEQLEYDLANFAQEMSDKSRMLIANEQAVEALNQRISILTKTRNDKVSAKSRIEAEIEMIKKRISQRDELVGKLAGLMKISDEIAGDRSNVMPFMNAANDRLHDVKVELELIKTDFDRKLGDLDKQVSEATDKKAAAEQTARISDERRRKFEVEFKTMQHQLRDIDSSAPRIKELQKVIDQLNEEVVNLEQGFNETSVMAEIESSASTRKDVETKVNLASVHEFLRDKKSSITGFEAELEKLTAKLRNCDVERKMVMEQLSEREKELKDYEEKILSVWHLAFGCVPQWFKLFFLFQSSLQPELSVEENIQSVSQDMERLQLEKGTLDGASYMYRKYIDFLHKRPCCPLCNRDFANQVESQQLLKELETNLKSLPEEQKCLKVKLQKSQRKHQDLLQLQPTASLAKKLRNDVIPSLKSKSSALVNGIQEAKKAISEVCTCLIV
ncbi:unnamed protein product [Soboliphyme baturini]|uniref:Zinc-hook domain-containing protein n=1 Tax=Soboliphyme baturini TaxID=241478 RepID=A0A183IWJ1_9BILA|nr:unnamed protein product [Soboliphyme baturini]